MLAFGLPDKEDVVARKTVLICDGCGKEVDESKGAAVQLTFVDARKASKKGDVCDVCASNIPGYAIARRGRKPKEAVEGSATTG